MASTHCCDRLYIIPLSALVRKQKKSNLLTPFHFMLCSISILQLLLLILMSIVISSSNQVIYKKLLNRFSTATHNYEFFVSQWTTLLYILPSLVVVLHKVVFMMTKEDRKSHHIEVKSSQTIYCVMGTLDAASSTLGGRFEAMRQ